MASSMKQNSTPSRLAIFLAVNLVFFAMYVDVASSLEVCSDYSCPKKDDIRLKFPMRVCELLRELPPMQATACVCYSSKENLLPLPLIKPDLQTAVRGELLSCGLEYPPACYCAKV